MNRFAALFSFALVILARAGMAQLTTPPNVGPMVTNPMPNYDQYIDSTRAIDLSAFFADPDSTAAATLTTSLGAITITLDGSHAPATVANFLNYVNSDRYFTTDPPTGARASTFFHRAVPNFVIQGGGFVGTSNPSTGGAQPTSVLTFPAVPNEPFISNIRGTIAMAKLGSDPNSATCQWFFNLADNSANLDVQNGGFTVFGHVTGNGMSVADAIATLPLVNAGSPYDSLPLRNYTSGNPIAVANLVSVPELRTSSPLAYTASSSDQNVATVTTSDVSLLVTTHQLGSAQITVNGNDLDGAGPVSQTFTVNVIAAPGRLRNISTRVSFPVGDEVQIPGFIMRGGTSKRLVVRGLGPSLSDGGVPNPISDPTLELRDINQALIASNDNWIDSPDKLLLAGLNLAPTSDKESALIVSVPSNASNANYTAIMRNRANAPGVGLVEVYDLDTAAGATLLNVSTRGEVGTGGDVLIGGLITGGTEARRLIIRAVGPSLAQQNVPGALQDPMLEIHNGQGTIIAMNDNWQTQINPNDVTEIQSRGFALSDPRESAVVLTVPSGGYTAIVKGAGSTTGVALVEVYQVE